MKLFIIDCQCFKSTNIIIYTKNLKGEKVNIYIDDFRPFLLIKKSNSNLINLSDIVLEQRKKLNNQSKITITKEIKLLNVLEEIECYKISFSDKSIYTNVKNNLIKRDIDVFNCDFFKVNELSYQFFLQNNLNPSLMINLNNYSVYKNSNIIQSYKCKSKDIVNEKYEFTRDNFSKLKFTSLTFDIECIPEIKGQFPKPENFLDYINIISFCKDIEYLDQKDRNKDDLKWYVYYVYEKDLIIDKVKKSNELYVCKRFETEEEMLVKFKYDLDSVDLISDFNGNNFDIPYVFVRLEKFFNIKSMSSFPNNINCYKMRENYINTFNGFIHFDLFKVLKGRDMANLNKENNLSYISKKYLRTPIKEIIKKDNKTFIICKKTDIYKNLDCIITIEKYDDILNITRKFLIKNFLENIDDNNYMDVEIDIEDNETIVLEKDNINYLSLSKSDMDFRDMYDAYKNKNEKIIIKSILYCLNDTKITKLVVLKNNYFNSYFSKNIIRETILRDSFNEGNSKLNQLAITREIEMKNYLYKRSLNDEETFSEKFEGATVLDVISGIHYNINGFDYSSLYPSIIIAFNICITTIVSEKQKNDFNIPEDRLNEVIIKDSKIYFFKKEYIKGVIPSICEKMIELRKNIKGKIKIETDIMKSVLLEIEQKNVKIANNSIYGSLGDSRSIHFDKRLAAAITSIGRKYLIKAKDFIENHKTFSGYKVIFGDTDSVYFKTPNIRNNIILNKKATDIEQLEMIKEFNSTLISPMSLEHDKFYSILFLIGKKKRIGIVVTSYDKNGNPKYKKEESGTSNKRRDVPLFLKELESNFFDYIVNNINDDINDDISNNDIVNNDINNKIKSKTYDYIVDYINNKLYKLSIDNFIIIKTLKDLNEYKSDNTPHVYLAKRMIKTGLLKSIEGGDKIKYLYAQSLSKNKYVKEKIMSLDEFNSSENKLDYKEYIRQIISLFNNNFSYLIDNDIIKKLEMDYEIKI